MRLAPQPPHRYCVDSMNRDEMARFWIDSSDSDATAMRHLHSSGDNAWALFIGHIVIE